MQNVSWLLELLSKGEYLLEFTGENTVEYWKAFIWYIFHEEGLFEPRFPFN